VTCQLDTGGCNERSNCGNGVVDVGEHCDGFNFGPLDGSCVGYDGVFFTGGLLTCSSSCRISTSSCSGILGGSCGDGIINLGEECDRDVVSGGFIFGTIDECSDYLSFVDGPLRCSSSCHLDTSRCNAVADCGNGIVDVGESCDGVNFDGASGECFDYSAFFSGGLLTCTSGCQLDTSSCLVAPTCGNSFIDDNEQCDGTNFGGVSTSCASFSSSFESGSLVCDGNCIISTVGCVERPPCGNNFIDAGESCDGALFASNSSLCSDFDPSFTGGLLTCTGTCQIDSSGCEGGGISFCGDGVISGDEQCDGPDLNGLNPSCVAYSSSFKDGALFCTDACFISTDDCIENPTCGNGFLDIGETCDTDLFVGGSTLCSEYDNTFTSGTLTCSIGCQIDTQSCIGSLPGFCGDGVINDAEQCDMSTFGLIDECIDFTQYVGGVLRCDSVCELDTFGCIPVAACGNGFLDSGELCDGFVFGFVDECTDFTDFIGGDLDCTSTCLLDTTGCIDVPTCGNGVIDANEDCDGTVFGAIDSCLDYPEFTSGVLLCSPSTCQLDTNACNERSACGNGVVDVGEQCDGSYFGTLDGTCTGFDSVAFTSGSLLCDSSCRISTESCGGVIGSCGDGFLNIGEECDGTLFGAIDECSDYSDFVVVMVLLTLGRVVMALTLMAFPVIVLSTVPSLLVVC